ncbi:plectin [Actinomadura parmotrematis]|uniref:Plectin n=1 Tax=Actinomadura parmotrematis TaxID=2864039 RepID=A0ABS7FQW0_9ACTN|nr:plectin [Actinomadura parmotrematis]MBW8482793.1 plectin [Actinomadura parmotrematis]
MPLGRRVSKDVAAPYEADRELAKDYRELLAAAGRAEGELRAAQEAGRPAAELHELSVAFDGALGEALAAAEAAERVEIGPKGYRTAGQDAKARRAAEIGRRKGLARPGVRPWSAEIDRLRTAREELRFSYRTRPTVADAPTV